ncbi:choice-of-anchor M domain-containing protein [Corynebacterium sp. ES2794-CONJ1]|uniref:choice-of-anchor M domain-containing protein n=1 Tax=unclassified Corynebacterium TaxID=2624378 RepID=UPI0021672090|nr:MULTISPECIES: choice-of-anchor M domain-containing protein [unclassified Corynebacterium]MCS4489973.1 choice-of-anchor M domain-containing protein [Corynebacterium sp. ES2775-CONJ]MCS4491664.1 choice-of-anchor M domain-containing protein [Corynebacterium sp. ES2715-CONJ3]MCS4531769.1 choice-of-anchor M domain-containing protein [Corynebacterium sp. ES2730-CONJ]MCU9519165.1 choice-of-anchor M domain-containing protein [Corynebacterium sp. ES2794-CONJ1]
MSQIATRRLAALLGSILISVILITAPAQAQGIELSSGHVDLFTVRAQDGGLDLAVKEDITGTGVIRRAEDITLIVGENAYSQETARVSEIGQASYFLPQSQQPGILWPGWDTLGVRTGGFSEITLTFESVSGPGSVYLFEDRIGGELAAVTSDGGFELTSGSTVDQRYPAHRHVNWAFTQAGSYQFEVVASGNGVSSNRALYTWKVGDTAALGRSQDDSSDLTHQDNSRTPSPSRNQSAPIQQQSRPQPARPQIQSVPAPLAPQAHVPQPGTCEPTVIPQIKDDTTSPARWVNFNDLQFHLGSAAIKDLPLSIGPVPRGKVWMIGSTQEPHVPWVGSNNQHPTMLEHTQGSVVWELVGFRGPGPMVVYSQGSLGTVVGEEWFRGANNQASGVHEIPRNSHVHPNWVFGAPGTYYVSIRQSVTLTTGEQAQGTGTLVFNVGHGDQSGHFDIGSVINPAGGQCDPGISQAQAIAPVPQAPAIPSDVSNGAPGETGNIPDYFGEVQHQNAAESKSLAEKIIGVLPFVIFGLGLFVLGAGSTVLINAMMRSRARSAVAPK